jgi:hypothetical protein
VAGQEGAVCANSAEPTSIPFEFGAAAPIDDSMENRPVSKVVDLSAYETSALKERLGALRRYL